MSEENKLDPELEALLSAEPPAPEEVNGVADKPARRGPPRRRGPDKHHQRVMGRPAPTAADGSPPPAVEPYSVPPSTEFEGSRDALTVWPKVLELCKLENFQPEQIQIRVKRVPVGPVDLKARNAQSAELVPLTGDQVCGGDYQSPSEALYYTIVRDYHLTYTGPAIYQLTFQYRFGKSGNIGGVPANCEIKLDHPDVLKRQLMAKEAGEAARAPMAGGYVPRPHYAPTQPQAAQGTAAAPAVGVSQREVDLMRELERENGYWKGVFEQQRNAPPPAVAPAQRDPRLPPEGMTAEEWDAVLAQRQAKAIGPVVVQSMMAMGLTPELLRSLQAMAQQTPAQPQVGALPVAAATPADPLAGFKSLIGMMDDLGKMKKNLAKAFGVDLPEEGAPAAEKEEDDPTVMKPVLGGVKFPGTELPMMHGEKREDEGWPEYLVRLGTANPAATQAIMEKLSKILDPKVFSDLLQKVLEKQAAAAPKQMAGAAPPPAKGWQPT